MTSLDSYLLAVAKRKAIDRKMSSPRVNYAIVAQLEEKDIPLLIEIIRVQNQALLTIEREPIDEEDSGVLGIVNIALNKVEELALSGSAVRWGEYPDGQN